MLLGTLVSREFTDLDKQVLIDEGVRLPKLAMRKRKYHMLTSASKGTEDMLTSASKGTEDMLTSASKGTEDMATSWGEVKRYLNPNPQLSKYCHDGSHKVALHFM